MVNASQWQKHLKDRVMDPVIWKHCRKADFIIEHHVEILEKHVSSAFAYTCQIKTAYPLASVCQLAKNVRIFNKSNEEIHFLYLKWMSHGIPIGLPVIIT